MRRGKPSAVRRRKPSSKRFRVAFSFAGEKRDYVSQVAAILALRFTQAAILYDRYHEAEFSRADLGFVLPKLYHDASDLIVIVVCGAYNKKEWCGLEWSAIFDLIKRRKQHDVMLCRFDQAQVEGLYSIAGYLELDHKTPDEAAALILQRLALNEGLPSEHYRENVTPSEESSFEEMAKPPIQPRCGPPHVVQPPDIIQVEVLDALPGRPISGERLVRPDGTISLGFYGDVHVAGLTVSAAKVKIIRHLATFLTDWALGIGEFDPCTGEPKIDEQTGQPVLRDPIESDTVFVDVTAYRSSHFYVQGYVHRPGSLAYTGGETVLDALQAVGGILPAADREGIRLIRSFPKRSPVEVLPIDYEEITMGTDSSTNYQILPNDRLVVPGKQTQGGATTGSAQSSHGGGSGSESRHSRRSSESHPGGDPRTRSR